MINGNTDVRSLAAQFVQADRASQDQYFNGRKTGYETTLKLYSTLTGKINELRDSLRTLTQNKQFEAFSVTQSAEGFANVSASGSTAAGQYEIVIDRLASAHQVALDFASETDPLPSSGQLTLGVGAEAFSIDLSTLPAGADLSKLRDAINADPANPGLKASIVRSGGAVKLLLKSEETGAANTLSMSTNGDPAMADIQLAIDGRTELSQARDARIFLGDNQALELTSATNNFTNVIDGVTIDLQKVHAPGETLTFTVGQDTKATKEQLQKIVDGYNGIVDAVAKNNGSNDSTSRALLQQLRAQFSNAGISSVGLEINRSGKLTVNTGRLEKFLEQNPAGLTELMSGTGGMLQQLTDRLDTFTKGDKSLLKSSTTSITASLKQLEQRMDRFDMRMDRNFDRYVAQFSQMQTMIAKMQQTSSMFF